MLDNYTRLQNKIDDDVKGSIVLFRHSLLPRPENGPEPAWVQYISSISYQYRVFSCDVTAAVLVSLNKGTAAMLVQSLNSPFFPPHIGAGRKESSGTGLTWPPVLCLGTPTRPP